MLQIGNNIISSDLIKKKFACDLSVCLGNCCRYGDAGAPIEEDELKILDQIITAVDPYLTEEGRRAIKEQGTSVRDIEGEMVTPLIDGKECAYTFREGNIHKCAIEKAWSEGKITFRKPLSCHLFPVRIKKYKSFFAINVEEWPVCFGGREKGKTGNIFVYEFLAEALKRALGEEVYSEICRAALEAGEHAK